MESVQGNLRANLAGALIWMRCDFSWRVEVQGVGLSWWGGRRPYAED